MSTKFEIVDNILKQQPLQQVSPVATTSQSLYSHVCNWVDSPLFLSASGTVIFFIILLCLQPAYVLNKEGNLNVQTSFLLSVFGGVFVWLVPYSIKT